ncbi:8135_t:CDS:2 [Acaulospora morrowiae]|uniref:Protoporphyrinogen oxidase n=1 Tax=Acaulospora morrowiae TaxID=94023 RepID=A0A9N8YSI2_9GLOM|nr:8135_t:CDS:2 [Acaulospora morrowiae]
MPPQHFVILGGGISGLTAAWYLALNAPLTTKITLLEASNRFGGWIQSTRVGDDRILFEQGPRTLRPVGLGGLVVLDMINRLKISEFVHALPKDAPAAQNRYIFYPNKLVKLPGSNLISGIRQTLSTKFLLKSLSAVVREPFVRPVLPNLDESVHSFFTRRFNEQLADILISALAHGIYAGDVKKLSMRSTFTNIYNMEKSYGSVIRGAFSRNPSPPSDEDMTLVETINRDNEDLMKIINKSSLYSFKDGIGQLTNALVKDLRGKPNVELKVDSRVRELKFEDGNEIEIITNNGKFKGDHIISTIPAYELVKLLPMLPHLEYNPFVTVGVVNVAYEQPNLLPIKGFGVLFPQATPDNRHHVLGIVFDSDTMPLQDHPKDNYTKVTVMLGGHYYETFKEEELPDEEELLHQALQTLETTLGIYATPAEYVAKLQRKCIPQYYVNHHSRLGGLHNAIKENFKNRLSVCGSSYLGVSINDCVFNSAKLALNLLNDSKKDVVVTGLERVDVKIE